MAKNDNLTWTTVDTGTLPRNAARAYAEYQKAQQAARVAREAFEATLVAAMAAQDAVPFGYQPLFSYKFGKVAFAMVEATEAKGKTKAAVFAFRK